jgi:hypothetical protein
LSEEIKKNHLLQYDYPSEADMEQANLRITFLGYFWKDWSLVDNGNFSALRGLEIRNEKPDAIGDCYGITSLDEDWVTFNQMIKYLKFGFGRITDYVNEDIRNGRMTREEAVDLCDRYDGACSSDYIKSFCRYIGISLDEFWAQVDKSVNPLLFEKIGTGLYKKKFTVGIGL